MGRMIPNTQDHDTAGFFAAAAEGRLVYRACRDCGRGLHPPTAHCPFCGGWNTEWRDAAGMGTLHSWTTVHQSVHPAYPAPYTLVVVALDDTPDVRLMGRIDGELELEAGMKMRVWFETLETGENLPQWRPAAD
jgi:uncharacterized OB-fold protein